MTNLLAFYELINNCGRMVFHLNYGTTSFARMTEGMNFGLFAGPSRMIIMGKMPCTPLR